MTYEEMMERVKAAENDIDYCPECGKIYKGVLSKFCYSCNCKLLPYTGNLPTCPTCHSTNVKKISFAKGYLHWRAFGLFSKTARSQFECKSCGYKF